MLELLIEKKRLKAGDKVLMIGHGFPLYSHQSLKFDLDFDEILEESSNRESFLPSISSILEGIKE